MSAAKAPVAAGAVEFALGRLHRIAQRLQHRSLPQQGEPHGFHLRRSARSGEAAMEFCRATSEQVGDGAADHVDVGGVGPGMQVDRQADVIEHLGPQIALVGDRVVHDHDVGGDALALERDDRVRDDTGDVAEAGLPEGARGARRRGSEPASSRRTSLAM